MNKNPVNNRINYLNLLAGFLPSTEGLEDTVSFLFGSLQKKATSILFGVGVFI